MPQVDFYVLSQETRERFVCRLAEKAFGQGLRVYIHAESAAQAQRLDEMLWTFRDISFIPHDRYPEALDSPAPVRIGYGAQACPGIRDLLVNLHPEVPPFFQEFSRIAEVLDQQPQVRAAGRARYRVYREHGAELKHHEL
jgi:DNA polymerase-3 subunit chi